MVNFPWLFIRNAKKPIVGLGGFRDCPFDIIIAIVLSFQFLAKIENELDLVLLGFRTYTTL